MGLGVAGGALGPCWPSQGRSCQGVPKDPCPSGGHRERGLAESVWGVGLDRPGPISEAAEKGEVCGSMVGDGTGEGLDLGGFQEHPSAQYIRAVARGSTDMPTLSTLSFLCPHFDQNSRGSAHLLLTLKLPFLGGGVWGASGRQQQMLERWT